MNEKVFIVDYELLSPIAFGKAELHENLKTYKEGENLVKCFDTSGLPFKVAAEVHYDLKTIYADEHPKIKETLHYDRKFELLVACFNIAKSRFEALCKNLDPTRGGVVMGIGADVVDLENFEESFFELFKTVANPYSEFIASHNQEIGPLNKIWNPYDLHSIYIAEKLQLAAFQKSTLTACTSSTQAIVSAFDSIRQNECDLVVCGGTDSIINPVALASFGKLGVIPENDGSDGPSCLVFDQNRKGTLAGEAAGLVVLVSEKYLKENKIKPLAEIVSYCSTLDGYKITAPDPDGTAIKRALKTAVQNAKIRADEIDYIQAHGTATRQNDPIELDAIKEVLGTHAKAVAISSTKDRHGHAIAAAGVQEFCILTNCMQHNFIPGNMNMKIPLDPEMNLLTENKSQHIRYGITNNFAFGGVNTVIIMKNVE